MSLTKKQEEICSTGNYDFSHLKALFLNCTLKQSPTLSHTEGLMKMSVEIMKRKGVQVEILRPVDYKIPFGVSPDMTKEGAEIDDWPQIRKKVESSNILVIGSPIWLGEKSSVCTQMIERLYSTSGNLNNEGQYATYGKVAGCIITGNEDGIKHSSMSILYALQHLGYTIPPQADAGWIGAVGPGPSYLDKNSGGPESDFTNRNTTFLTWNLMHMAAMLHTNNGIPAHGNQRAKWDAGCRFDSQNPEYR